MAFIPGFCKKTLSFLTLRWGQVVYLILCSLRRALIVNKELEIPLYSHKGSFYTQQRGCKLPRHHLERLDCRYLLALEVFHHIKLIRGLQVQPELRCCAEVAGKARRCIGCDSSFAVHNLIDAPGRHADCHRHLILGNPEPFNEVFQQDFSGVNWRNFVSDSQRSLPPRVLNRST